MELNKLETVLLKEIQEDVKAGKDAAEKFKSLEGVKKQTTELGKLIVDAEEQVRFVEKCIVKTIKKEEEVAKLVAAKSQNKSAEKPSTSVTEKPKASVKETTVTPIKDLSFKPNYLGETPADRAREQNPFGGHLFGGR